MVEAIISAVRQEKLIAIFRNIHLDQCMCVAQALYDGGIRLMELTYDQNAPETWEQTATTVGALATKFAGRMYVGAGTVTSPELVELTYRHGGQFVVSPDVNEAVIQKTCQLGLVSISGAMTPSEIMAAHRAGAHFVKVFPAGVLGAPYLKAVKAPASHVELIAFGGIDEHNLPDFLQAGACGAGIGVSLVNPHWVSAGEYGKIMQAAQRLVSLIK